MGAINGQVAIVTGASGGIGKAICKVLAREGAEVVASYFNNRAGVEVTAAAVKAAGRQVEVVKANTGLVLECRALVDRAVDRFGKVDLLVNNAGIYPRSWALEMQEEEWDQVVDTNLKGTFFCCQAAARVMKPAGYGRIINIGSLAMRGATRGAHYSATKAGISALTRTLAFEWAPEVLVNCIAPGIVDTPQPRYGLNEDQIAERVRNLPVPRIGMPEDIAGAVLYLVSKSGNWITGQTLHINGGDWMP